MDDYRASKASTNYFFELLKNVAVSLIVTFIILLIAALLLCFTDFPEMYTLPSAIAGTILGVFAGSTLAARKNPAKSLASGLLTAFIYAILAFIIGCIIQGKITFTLNTALFAVIALLTGAIASIMASRPKKPSKYGSGPSSLADRFLKKKAPKGYSFKSGRL